MRIYFCFCVMFFIVSLALAASTARAAQSGSGLIAEKTGSRVAVRGEHFCLECDADRGGLIVGLQVSDGTNWNRLIGGDDQPCPAISITADGGNCFTPVKCKDTRIEDFVASAEKASWTVISGTRDKNGDLSPWRMILRYEVFAEGAVFIDLELKLLADNWSLASATLEFQVDETIVDAPKFRQEVFTRPKTVLPSGRIAFGMNPRHSFTNEIAVFVERNVPLGKTTGFAERPGRFTWKLGEAPAALQKGYSYRNRIAIGLTCPLSGKPQSNLFGQRVYHWVNYLDRAALKGWYPTDEQIDCMADNGATMLIMHQDWMLQGGRNGKPHADYSAVKHEQAIRRVIAKAHQRGMRIGLYRRGIERYSLGQVFDKYLKRNWDGFYVDWHGPHAVAEHEMKNNPDAGVSDEHYSQNGNVLAARDYFEFAKGLREIVGPDGFLIGHMGFGCAGIFPNFCFDAYLPGEYKADHLMFTDRDKAVFSGMTCGAVCMPWPADSKHFSTPEGVAKMAAWGFYPHVCLGLQRGSDDTLFPLDPDAAANKFPLAYWRVLSKIDFEYVTTFNLPNQSHVVMRSSNPAVEGVVYAEDKNGRRDYLLVVANLSEKPAQSTLSLDRKILGMSGKYKITRIDSQTGATYPHSMDDNRIKTPQLPPWGITGFKIDKIDGRNGQ